MTQGMDAVLEITDTHIKLLKVKKAGSQKIICGYWFQKIQFFSDDRIDAVLTKEISSHIKVSDKLAVIIPRRNVILKKLKLPSQNPEELRRMINVQLMSLVPFPAEDVTFDFKILNKDQAGYAQVLIVLVNKDVTNRYLNLLSKTQNNIQRMAYSSEGVLNWIKYQKQYLKWQNDESLTVINVDVETSEICFYGNNQLFFSRHINFGAQNLITSELEEWIKQIDLSWQNYNMDQMGPEIKRIVITGNVHELNLLRQRLEKIYNLSVIIVSDLSHVQLSDQLKRDDVLSKTNISLVSELGILLGGDIAQLCNLTPSKVVEGKKTKQKTVELIQAGLLGLFAVLLGLCILGIKLYQKSDIVQKWKSDLSSLEQKAKEAEKKIKFVNFFEEEFQKRVMIADLMLELNQLAPNSISFQNLSLNEKGALTIQGYAQTRVDINNFQTQLVNSPNFKDIKLDSATERKIYNQDFVDFRLMAQLKDYLKKE